RMLVYDGLDLSFDTVTLAKSPTCPCCSKPSEEIVLRAEPMVCSAPQPGGSITAEALLARLEASEDVLLLDVRNPPEWTGGVIPGALTLPKPEIEAALRASGTDADAALAAIRHSREVVIYCQGGTRSAAVIRSLAEAGYDPRLLANLEGGFAAWEKVSAALVPVGETAET
ncbi:rhodanese-like domain-containing protein, partial [Roseomonas sp. GCM10028921]